MGQKSGWLRGGTRRGRHRADNLIYIPVAWAALQRAALNAKGTLDWTSVAEARQAKSTPSFLSTFFMILRLEAEGMGGGSTHPEPRKHPPPVLWRLLQRCSVKLEQG